MSIAIQCPHCGRGYRVKDELGGKRFKCQCGQAVAVAAATGLMNLLDDELTVAVDPKDISDPNEWAKATGNADLADELQSKMSAGLANNQTFMMGLVCGLAALMLIIGLSAILLAGP